MRMSTNWRYLLHCAAHLKASTSEHIRNGYSVVKYDHLILRLTDYVTSKGGCWNISTLTESVISIQGFNDQDNFIRDAISIKSLY